MLPRQVCRKLWVPAGCSLLHLSSSSASQTSVISKKALAHVENRRIAAAARACATGLISELFYLFCRRAPSAILGHLVSGHALKIP